MQTQTIGAYNASIEYILTLRKRLQALTFLLYDNRLNTAIRDMLVQKVNEFMATLQQQAKSLHKQLASVQARVEEEAKRRAQAARVEEEAKRRAQAEATKRRAQAEEAQAAPEEYEKYGLAAEIRRMPTSLYEETGEEPLEKYGIRAEIRRMVVLT